MSEYLYPHPDKKICFNCEHYRHLIALGQGLRCGHPQNIQADGKPLLIPSRHHTCEHFQRSRKYYSNHDFHLSEESLKEITATLENWRREYDTDNIRTSPITVSFTFDNAGRTVEVRRAASHEVVKIEETKY